LPKSRPFPSFEQAALQHREFLGTTHYFLKKFICHRNEQRSHLCTICPDAFKAGWIAGLPAAALIWQVF
jgi:hypothetical protein